MIHHVKPYRKIEKPANHPRLKGEGLKYKRAEARNGSRFEYGEVVAALVSIFVLVLDVVHHHLVSNGA